MLIVNRILPQIKHKGFIHWTWVGSGIKIQTQIRKAVRVFACDCKHIHMWRTTQFLIKHDEHNHDISLTRYQSFSLRKLRDTHDMCSLILYRRTSYIWCQPQTEIWRTLLYYSSPQNQQRQLERTHVNGFSL